MKNNLLETLKENDIVMIEIPSTERSHVKEICRIYNLKFTKADEKSNFDWLDFDGEILYTNIKLHKSMMNEPIGNCMSITHKIDKDHVEQMARVNDMWKSDMYLLSDAELEQKRAIATAKLDF